MEHLREFIQKYWYHSDKRQAALEKELLEAIKADGFISIDDHNLAVAKASEQAYEEGYNSVEQ